MVLLLKRGGCSLKYQFHNQKNTIGNISDFRSIRFMRMFMTDFNDQVTVRFALDLVRGEWRRYTNTLDFNDTMLLMTTQTRCFSSKCPRK
jgi:cell surface protein SprA